MEDNQLIIDSENYRGGSEGFGYREIVLRQLQRVVTNLSREMKEGFWIYANPNPQMSPVKIKYIGDSRKELIQSIDCLHDLLMPKFDADMKKQSKELNKEIEDLEKNIEPGKTTKEAYWSNKLKIYRKLFQQLCLFLERIGWLEGEQVQE